MSATAVEDMYRLSPLQQGILFQELAAPGAGLYLLHRGYELTGRVTAAAIEEAWRAAVARHPPLRSSFHWRGLEAPVQVVHEEVSLPMTIGDWGDVPEEDLEQRIEALAASMMAPFDLERPPLVRAALLRLTDERHYFAWTFHHILMEGWSSSIVLDEVFSDCRARIEGRDWTPPVRRPFGDYLIWLEERGRANAETFWTERLRDFTAPTPVLEAKSTTETTDLEDSRYVAHRAVLSESVTERLRDLARRHGMTLNTVLQGAWAILLSRYSRGDDVVFGCTVSGRSGDLEGVDSIVGMLVNTLPARVKVRYDQPLVAWLKEIQSEQAQMRAFEWTSLIDIHGWSEVPRTSPLFESIVVFSNWRSEAEPVPGPLEVTERYSSEGGTGYPLTLSVAPDTSAVLTLSFDADRYEDDQCSRLLGHLATLLGSIADDPDRPVGALQMLPIRERDEILGRNATSTVYPRDRRVHQLFEEQAALTPEQTALMYGDTGLSYRALDDRANRLAQYLVGLGVQEGDLVGVCIERSLDMVVAILGIMKSGAAYVPIEPSLPMDRISFMISDAGVAFLVTTSEAAKAFQSEGIQLVLLDGHAEKIEAQKADAPREGLSADGLAYVIYTSGSTGRPKGVEIEHRCFTNFLCAMKDEPGFGPDDRLLAVTTMSFDISGLELFLPIISGGTVVIADRDTVSDARALTEVLAAGEVTVMQATPATWRLLLDAGWKGQSGLKALCGGEAVPLELAGRLAECCDNLWNMYGPTETTIWSTACRIEPGVDVVSIGRPIANTQVYVLDDRLEPVPDGVLGNLYIGGDGLARGYRDRASLTRARFVTSPFDQGSDRIYNTGDVARFLPDGRLQCLGRTDHQVKVRGFRIELGEIEAVLSRHDAVCEAAVSVRAFGEADQRLVAYVVFEPDEEALPSELRAFLRDALPDYMVPHIFHPLAKLPLTSSAKVDRNALPDPEGYDIRDSSGTEPGTPIEKLLADIWQQVLRKESVKIEDNFFELGGHSLLAMQVASKVEEAIGYRVNPLRMTFLTLGQFAVEFESAVPGKRPGAHDSNAS